MSESEEHQVGSRCAQCDSEIDQFGLYILDEKNKQVVEVCSRCFHSIAKQLLT